jgi:hypothetical protein
MSGWGRKEGYFVFKLSYAKRQITPVAEFSDTVDLGIWIEPGDRLEIRALG